MSPVATRGSSCPTESSTPISAPPATAGTYALLIELDRTITIEVGRVRRKIALEAGAYCYVGSALGPGGIRARLRRHAASHKKPHWHIDFLLHRARLTGAIFTSSGRHMECEWARWVDDRAVAAVPGFGASDCRCPSHLFQLGPPTSVDSLVTAAELDLTAEHACTGTLRL